jgi:hypothetical protein
MNCPRRVIHEELSTNLHELTRIIHKESCEFEDIEIRVNSCKFVDKKTWTKNRGQKIRGHRNSC